MREHRVFAVAVVALSMTLAPEAVAVVGSGSHLYVVDSSRPGHSSQGAVGTPIEALNLSTGRLNASTTAWFRPMRLLGPSLLRIGGNSVDLHGGPVRGTCSPWATSTVTPGDLTTLHKLLNATGWRVLLGADLAIEPARAADEARYARKILGKSSVGIEIGNEPNKFTDKQVDLPF